MQVYEEMKTILEKVTPGDLLKISEKKENNFEDELNQAIFLCVEKNEETVDPFGIKWFLLSGNVTLRSKIYPQVPHIKFWIVNSDRGNEYRFNLVRYSSLWERYNCEVL